MSLNNSGFGFQNNHFRATQQLLGLGLAATKRDFGCIDTARTKLAGGLAMGGAARAFEELAASHTKRRELMGIGGLDPLDQRSKHASTAGEAARTDLTSALGTGRAARAIEEMASHPKRRELMGIGDAFDQGGKHASILAEHTKGMLGIAEAVGSLKSEKHMNTVLGMAGEAHTKLTGALGIGRAARAIEEMAASHSKRRELLGIGGLDPFDQHRKHASSLAKHTTSMADAAARSLKFENHTNGMFTPAGVAARWEETIGKQRRAVFDVDARTAAFVSKSDLMPSEYLGRGWFAQPEFVRPLAWPAQQQRVDEPDRRSVSIEEIFLSLTRVRCAMCEEDLVFYWEEDQDTFGLKVFPTCPTCARLPAEDHDLKLPEVQRPELLKVDGAGEGDGIPLAIDILRVVTDDESEP